MQKVTPMDRHKKILMVCALLFVSILPGVIGLILNPDLPGSYCALPFAIVFAAMSLAFKELSQQEDTMAAKSPKPTNYFFNVVGSGAMAASTLTAGMAILVILMFLCGLFA